MHFPFKWLIGVVSTICLQLSCTVQNEKINIEAYYFPIDNLREGKVYEYRPVNSNNLPVEYWLFKSEKSDSGTFLNGQFYEYDFDIKQSTREEIVDNGSLMTDYVLYYPADSTGQAVEIPAQIIYGNTFPFGVKDSLGVFLYKIKWHHDPNDAKKTTSLIRNRRFRGKTTCSINNKVYNCVTFSVREIIEIYEDGYQELEFSGEERYAQHIGLAYYKKNIDESFALEYQLSAIYDMQQWEEKMKKTKEY